MSETRIRENRKRKGRGQKANDGIEERKERIPKAKGKMIQQEEKRRRGGEKIMAVIV